MLLAVKPVSSCLTLLCMSLVLLLLAPHQKPTVHPHLLLHSHHHRRPPRLHRQIIEPSAIAARARTSCPGRRIYIHKLPPSLNAQLLLQCRYAITSWLDFCSHLTHHGLGEPLHPQQQLTPPPDNLTSSLSAHSSGSSFKFSQKAAPNSLSTSRLTQSQAQSHDSAELSAARLQGRLSDWHRTDAYMLEVIFHHRLLQYPCLTEDPDMADAFFLPYYAGIDALNYLYGKRKSSPKAHGAELAAWLQQDTIAKRAWKKHKGKDHFLVMGRTPWDFGNVGSGQWGTGILHIPEYKNMTLLLIEKQPWMPNQHAVPYPTSFHPSSSPSLQAWIQRVRTEDRPTLFTFAGSIRPALMKGGIRDKLMDQCLSSGDCKLLDCKELKCSHNPEPIMAAFLRSQFCLQPRGDTPTRRSLFDAIIAGCIPVLFHNDTAYTQYEWHLPNEASKWSVYIEEAQIRKGVLVRDILKKYGEEDILKMREMLMSVLPKVVYTKTPVMKQGEADAFDVSVEETLKLIFHKKSGRKILGDRKAV